MCEASSTTRSRGVAELGVDELGEPRAVGLVDPVVRPEQLLDTLRDGELVERGDAVLGEFE